MRYKQDLAEFLPIADGARLIQERAGITEDEAREDILAAVQDDEVAIRWFSVTRGERRRGYASDLPHGFLDNLTVNNIDWETSIACRRRVGDAFAAEIEVKRDDLFSLYPLLDNDGDREEEPAATKGPQQPCGKKPAEQKPRSRRKRDKEAEAKLRNKIESVHATALRIWKDPKKRPPYKTMAKHLAEDHGKKLGYKFNAIHQILIGTYRASKDLGIGRF